MSNTKREPLLSDVFLGTLMADEEYHDGPKWYPSSTQVRNIYEADRAKDAELIQMLVDALKFERESLVSCGESAEAMEAAEAAGFKPTGG